MGDSIRTWVNEMRFLHNSVALLASVMAASLVPIITASFAQMPHDRWELSSILGKLTIVQDTLPKSGLLKGAEVMGEFDWDRDGRPEIFAVKSNPISQSEFDNHLIVFRKQPDGAIRLDREYTMRDDKIFSLHFFEPPDARDRTKVIVWAVEGAWTGTTYLVQSDIPFSVKLGSATNLEVLDLNGDGVYEAVAWNRRPEDRRCHFGFFGVRVMPRIYARVGKVYQCIWPMQPAPWHGVMSQFADVDDDGRPEIVSLEDNERNETGAQRLSIYKMDNNKFRMLARVDTPWPNIAVFLSVTVTGKLELKTATQQRYNQDTPATNVLSDAELGTKTTRYEFRNGVLRRLRERE
jgi:hypothetical protein